MFSINEQIKYIKTDWNIVLKEIIDENKNNADFCNKIVTLNTKINGVNIDILYPPLPLIFHAFNLFDFNKLKVVILGQDPYHQKNQAMGLSFSINKSLKKVPPSLKNIFKELNDDLNINRSNVDLTDWAKQGVLLLNNSLTVVDSSPNIHQKQWAFFTDAIINKISQKKSKYCLFTMGK